MKSRILLVLGMLASFAFLATPMPAAAMTLEQARALGAVGEKLDGYVAVLKSSPDVQALVSDINVKRQQEYAKISKNTGQSIDVVARLAAQQIVEKLSRGSLYQTPDNVWKPR